MTDNIKDLMESTGATKEEAELTIKVSQWFNDFKSSTEYKNLSKTEKKEAENIVVAMTSLMYENYDLVPEDWNEEALKDVCIEDIPSEKFDEDDSFFESIPNVLHQFFSFLESKNEVKQAAVMASMVKDLGGEIQEGLEEIERFYENAGVAMEEDFDDEDGEELLDSLSTQIYKWWQEFSETEYFKELTEEQQEYSEYNIMTFSEHMLHHTYLPPDLWDAEDMEECCLEVLPEVLTAEKVYFTHLAANLSSFFTFLSEEKELKSGKILAKKARKLEDEIVKASQDTSKWGMAKNIMMRALEEGVDFNDEKAVKRYLEKLQGEQVEIPGPLQEMFSLGEEDEEEESNIIPFRRPEAKVGRNEPCTCGSGKKYKKCCGK